MDRTWTIAEFVLTSKTRYDRYTPMKLSQLMEHAHNCHSSDSRDKIYAFSGLTDPRHGIEPAYDVTLNTARIRAAKAVMRIDQSLDILICAIENTHINTADDPLPSWVPEFWSASLKRNSAVQAFREKATLHGKNYQAGGQVFQHPKFMPDPYGNTDKVMEAEGLHVDVLGKLLNDDDDDDDCVPRVFAGKGAGTWLTLLVPSRSQMGDEVWVLVGASEPFVLRRYASDLRIIGNAMVQERDAKDGTYTESSMMMGSLYEHYGRNGEVRAENLRLV